MLICETVYMLKEDEPISMYLIKSVAVPGLVGVFGFLLARKFSEWKNNKDNSLYALTIVELLLEEVSNGLNIMKGMNSLLEKGNNNDILHTDQRPLPNKSWAGTETFPPEVLLRIIAVSAGKSFDHFHPSTIRIHTKNYFEFITSHWERLRGGITKGNTEQRKLLGHIIEGSEGVEKMLVRTRDLLKKNTNSFFSK